MSDEISKFKESIGQFKPAELDDADRKIAKKRAKKLKIPVDLAERARLQEKNVEIVRALTNFYNDALNVLGFVLEAVMKFSEKGITAAFDLRPMNAGELKFYAEKMASLKKDNEEKKPIPDESKETPVAESSVEEVKKD